MLALVFFKSAIVGTTPPTQYTYSLTLPDNELTNSLLIKSLVSILEISTFILLLLLLCFCFFATEINYDSSLISSTSPRVSVFQSMIQCCPVGSRTTGFPPAISFFPNPPFTQFLLSVYLFRIGSGLQSTPPSYGHRRRAATVYGDDQLGTTKIARGDGCAHHSAILGGRKLETGPES